nr:radical SAM protein [Candidatus Sigynarchaeota archaeon]
MKIALVFPNYLESFFIMPASSHQPLGLAMVASVLQRAGHEVMVFDAMADKLNMHVLAKRIKQFNPAMIGITTNVSYGWKAVLTGRWLKRALPGATVVFGGPWATTEHDTILKQHAADVVVRGEGELTIVELADAIQRGEKYFASVKGIAFLQDGNVVVTPSRELITRLDDLPFPDWKLFPKSTKYNIGFKGERHFPVMTSRGCPFDCINCSKFVHGYAIRNRSIDNVIAEIKYLKAEFNANEVVFIDDAFNFDIERVEALCDEIMKLEFKVHIRCPSIRADRVTPRVAWKMKLAGVYDAAIGIESGNQAIVNMIGKKLDLSLVKRAIRIFKKLNI